MSIFAKIRRKTIRWLSQRLGVVVVIAIIGGLVPAFGFITIASAQEAARIEVENFSQFGRIVINFDNRSDLPKFQINSENGILIVQFDQRINFSLPDVAEILPQFVVASRIDPDYKAIRFGLKGEFNIHKTEAGQRLYIDILPLDWQGAMPALPTEVVEELSKRAKDALIIAERKIKNEYVRDHQPSAKLKIGRHPNFIRLIVEWSIDTKAVYSFNNDVGEIKFDWPVAIDVSELQADLPKEIKSVTNRLEGASSLLVINVADNIRPRYYSISQSEFIIDIDKEQNDASNLDLASILPEGSDYDPNEEKLELSEQLENDGSGVEISNDRAATIIPTVEKIGSTIRMTFPFEDETPAAVFRRGDMLWLVFDSFSKIGEPEESKEFSSIANGFSVVGAGGTSIVRINLSTQRLATLGSEGRSWVLSLGDVVLAPLELIGLTRRQTGEGLFEVVANLQRASNVHQLRDPIVGDVLEVVTAYPPAIGVARDLSLVEFSALRSIHGLVIKPLHDNIFVRVDGKNAIISSDRGLIVSTSKGARLDKKELEEGVNRDGFIDLNSLQEKENSKFFALQKEIMQRASVAERNTLGATRLQLAQFFLANELYYEALGILNLIDKEQVFGELGMSLVITRAAATAMVMRSKEAVVLLSDKRVVDNVDAMVWRTIAKVGIEDFEGARVDSLAAESVVNFYPDWVRAKFYYASVEAAIETNNVEQASRLISLIETNSLSVEKINEYKVLLARIDAAEGRYEQALDGLGQVIAADFRPSRASAIYYTMEILKRMDKLDVFKGAQTLSAESIVWRDNKLEVKMTGLLANLYFDSGSYREAFEVSSYLAKTHPNNEISQNLMRKSQQAFSNLFLNGEAESLPPIKALSLYYDYRYLTPAGARGDEMIRNLSRRLVKVDLLEQASELLKYQVDERLEGVAKAQIAADLAIIYLADRLPERAIEILHATQLSGIPKSLARQRRIIEARALIDVGREDLSLDILSRQSGKDVDLIRVDAHWKGKRYGEAAQIIEQLYYNEQKSGNLSIKSRADIIKAGVGYVLSDDWIGLTRLRLKYGEVMSKTAEWGMFDFVTARVNATSLEFKKVAQEIANSNSLKAFLNAYSESYGPDGALTPLVKS